MYNLNRKEKRGIIPRCCDMDYLFDSVDSLIDDYYDDDEDYDDEDDYDDDDEDEDYDEETVEEEVTYEEGWV